jgi:branched-subunit amino acid aminotransferase/4-amino-4-deoxychorismate lyase
MAQLRMDVSHVADEALILSPDGIIVEGAYSAIVVIDAEEGEFSITPSKYPRIESVTEQLVCELARDEHFDVIKRTHTISDLEGKEVWVLSALHGIRAATEIVGGPSLAINMERRAEFHDRLREYEYPLDGVF